MNDAAISQIVRERNPWWLDPQAWRDTDGYLRELSEAPFDYRPEVLQDIEAPGLYVLTGPRRVGKSAELRRRIAALIDQGVPARNIVHCSCDGFREQDLRRLFTVGRQLTRTVEGPLHWLIDEITAVGDGWSAVIKDLRDNTPLRGDCVVLTGSSARGLREATKNLAGRRGGVSHSSRLLFPMGFRDFALATRTQGIPQLPVVHPRDMRTRQTRELLNELFFHIDALNDAWVDYLRIGGYPRAVSDLLRHGEVQSDFITDLWDVIRGEVIGKTTAGDPEILALLHRLGTGLGSPVNLSKVADDVGFSSNHRVEDRIEDLTQGYITWRCYRSKDGVPHTRAQRKLYFLDPLTARLAQARQSTYSAPDDTKLAEQQLGLALARVIAQRRPTSFTEANGVLHQRTKTEAEIDFVGEDLGLAYEAKYGQSHWRREAQTIEASYPDAGIIATQDIYDTSHSAWAVPASMVAWLLG